jgi:putative DNA primase/helicase
MNDCCTFTRQPTKETVELDEGPVLTRIIDITPQEVEWLWPGRIAMRRISLIVGRPGEGKSFVALDVAARVSTGTPWPDGTACLDGDVLLITSEDDPADTIRPRLEAANADMTRVQLMSSVRKQTMNGRIEEIPFQLQDIEAIEAALLKHKCRLIVLDPIGSFLGAGVDAYRDNAVRAILVPLARLAAQYNAAVVVVAHHRKARSGSADDQVLGSRAFTALARAVWHVGRAKDDPDRRLFLPGKNNLAPDGQGLAFHIVRDGQRAHLFWESDPVDLRADELAGERRTGEPMSAVARAVEWLVEFLGDGPRPTETIQVQAAQQGIKRRTLQRASTRLGILKVPGGFQQPWSWRLPSSTGDAGET